MHKFEENSMAMVKIDRLTSKDSHAYIMRIDGHREMVDIKSLWPMPELLTDEARVVLSEASKFVHIVWNNG